MDRRTDVAIGAAPRRLRLVVPVVMTIAVIASAVAAVATSTGCGDDSPRADAGVDAAPDTPIV